MSSDLWLFFKIPVRQEEQVSLPFIDEVLKGKGEFQWITKWHRVYQRKRFE
jgi:hypothetical protein